MVEGGGRKSRWEGGRIERGGRGGGTEDKVEKDQKKGRSTASRRWALIGPEEETSRGSPELLSLSFGTLPSLLLLCSLCTHPPSHPTPGVFALVRFVRSYRFDL